MSSRTALAWTCPTPQCARPLRITTRSAASSPRSAISARARTRNITGYEFHVINLVSQVCPHYLIKPYLEETLEELKTREPEEKFPFRARVVLVGSEVDDPEFTKLIETCGAMVVADRYCFGSVRSPRRDRDSARRDRVRRHLPPLPALEPVRPLHGRREDRPAPRRSHQACARLQGKRRHL